jgi:hypothetical protein
MPTIRNTSDAAITARVAGDTTLATLNLIQDSSFGNILHMITGPNTPGVGVAGSEYGLIAMGIDNGGIGLVIRNKLKGIGQHIEQLDTITEATSFGLLVNHYSSVAAAVRFNLNSTATKPLLILHASTAPAFSLLLQADDNGVGGSTLAGRIFADTGQIDWRRTIQTIAPNSSGTPLIRVADEVASNPTETYLAAKTNGDTGLRVYRWSGSAALMYASAWLATTDRIKLVVGNGAQNKGSETLNTLIEGRVNATPLLGFFGVTPAAQPAATADIKAGLATLGLLTAGGASPLNLEGGLLTSAGALFSAAAVVENNIPWRVKEAGGTARNVAIMSVGGTMSIGDNAVTVNYLGSQLNMAPGGVAKMTFNSGGVSIPDGVNIALASTTGTKIGTATTQKLGFFNATPVVKPTGVAVDAAGIHAALVSLGLIGA